MIINKSTLIKESRGWGLIKAGANDVRAPFSSKAVLMASSSPRRHSPSDNSQLLPISDGQSPLSSVIYELSQQVQAGMENMLKMVSEIDQSSSGVTEDMEKCNDSALERKRSLEEEKELFQKAAYSVLDMLNSRENN